MNEYFKPKKEIVSEEVEPKIKPGDLVGDSLGIVRVFVRYDEKSIPQCVFIKNIGRPNSEAMKVRADTIYKIEKPDSCSRVGDEMN